MTSLQSLLQTQSTGVACDLESDSTVTPEADHRYLYYRIFTEDVGVPVKIPVFADNPYVGRVRANSIPPPQTVLLIKRRLCTAEDISDFSGSTLYSYGSTQPLPDDGKRLPILTPGGLGSTPDEPMEIVGKFRPYKRPMFPRPQYIYYSLYSEDGEIRAQNPIDGEHPSIARIDYNLTAPPHSLKSVIRCISHIEGFPYCFWHRLFLGIASDSPMTDLNNEILENGGPGTVPEKSFVFVRANPMRKYIRARDDSHGDYIGLLSYLKSHALCSDGVIRQEGFPRPMLSRPTSQRYNQIIASKPMSYHSVYRGYNETTGEYGYIWAGSMDF